MNIEKANNKVIKIENEINDILNKKEEALINVLPKAKEIKQDVVYNSRTEKNEFLHYVYSIDEYDKKIDYLTNEKRILIVYINNELKRLKKYNKLKELIVYYRENHYQKQTWSSISNIVKLSKSQCKDIYRECKNKRNF